MKITTKYLILTSTVLLNLQLFADTKPTEKLDSIALNELVVEASRSETKLKAISNSVTLLNFKQIESLGLNTLTDVTSTVPNLFMPDYGSKLTSPIYIRGIGSRINAPSVGLYVDNVPYFEKAAFNFDFFDLSRIEVLRGPQGTEYGRNTMGGIVNIRTLSPLNYQGTNLTLQAASYGSYLVNAAHYAKPSDKFAWSLAVNYRHNDGYYTNLFTNKKVDVLDSYGFRNRLIWLVNERFSVENIVSYENSKQGGYPYALYYPANDSVAKINYNQKSGYDRQLVSDAFLIKYKGEKFDITSTTSYQYLNDNQYIDQDFTRDSVAYATQKQKQQMLSEEFIIKSKNDKKYRWLFGASGFVQQFDTRVLVDYYKTKNNVKYTNDKTYDHIIAGGAIFHQSTVKDFPIKNLELSAGLRIEGEADQLDYKHDSILMVSKKVFNKKDTSYNSLNSLQFLPKFSINYKLGNTNIYSTVSKGYKTGGFNNTFQSYNDLTFEPEYSWNYELGAKSELFNSKLFVEASLFLIDWKNQQVTRPISTGGTMLKNAGHSKSKGFELAASTAPIYGFELISAYGYTYAKFEEYIYKVDDKGTVDYSGNYIPYVPRHTVSAQLRKTVVVRQPDLLDKVVFNVIYKGVGSLYWNDANAAKQDYYNTIDARISFIRKNIQLDIWGTNLSSTDYIAYYFKTSKDFAQSGKPLQVGAKLALKF